MDPWEKWILGYGLSVTYSSVRGWLEAARDYFPAYREGKITEEQFLTELEDAVKCALHNLDNLRTVDEVRSLGQSFASGGEYESEPGEEFGAWSFDINNDKWILVSSDPGCQVLPEEAFKENVPIILEVSANGSQARVDGGVWWLVRAVRMPEHREIENTRCYSNRLDWATGHSWKVAHL